MATATSKPAVSSTSTTGRQLQQRPRKDKGNLHATRHGVLSRYALEALARLGEDPRKLRRLERKFRLALQPRGHFGDVLFDRWWSSYLRLILIARLEAMTATPEETQGDPSASLPSLLEGPVPTLVLPSTRDEQGTAKCTATDLPPDLFRRLAIVQRYDRHFSREMYRALAPLLLMREGGEAAVMDWLRDTLAVSKKTGNGESNA